jgi:hypothetical protein
MTALPRHESSLDRSLGQAGSTTIALPKRPYSTPRLECLGDVRDLTLGGSLGLADSGQEGEPYQGGSGSLMDRPAPGGSPAPDVKP